MLHVCVGMQVSITHNHRTSRETRRATLSDGMDDETNLARSLGGRNARDRLVDSGRCTGV